jgi:RNA polymerase sigma-70 factor (ECF subfamily)
MRDLRELLRTHQAVVYTISLQVLRREHDAEDAAQEALIQIARGASNVREPRALARWICRVALTTALDHLRRRTRRARHEEARAAMTPLRPDPAADALHEAMARLDDDERCLLVEKYFERRTLEEIGDREGVSAAAVGKRIERAKENLKRRLGLAALGAIALLEAARPAPRIPDLVSTSAAVKAAIAGGAAVGTKAVHVGIGVAVVLLLLLGTGVYVNRTGRSPSPPSRPAGRADVATPLQPESPERAKEFRAPEPPSVLADKWKPAADPAELLARLDRYKSWLAKTPAAFKTADDVNRWFEGAKAEAEGLRDLILGDPATFLAWLTRPENRTCASNLFSVTLCGKQSMWDEPAQDFATFPRDLTDGLLALLHGEDDFLRCAVLQFAVTVKDAPAAYRDRCLALLSDPYDFVSDLASKILLTTGTLTPSEVSGLASYLERVKDFDKRSSFMQSVGRNPREDIRDWMLTTLESQRFADPEGLLTYAALDWWLEPGRSPGSDFEERAGRLLAATMRRVEDPNGYFYLLFGGVSLPLKEARALLAIAQTGAPSEQLRKAAASMLALSDNELKDSSTRRGAWLTAYWAK